MLQWLQDTAYSEWVRESWGWPLALTVHAFGNAIVAGLMLIIGLRMFGLFRTIPFMALNKLFTIIWIGVVLQVCSGATLWMTKPAAYIGDGIFLVKVTLVVIGAVVTWQFQKYFKREAPGWDATGTAPSIGVKFGVAGCLAWTAVLVMGRLTAYLGSLYTS